MGMERYFCSHCNDFVSRGTQSNDLKELAEANGSFYDTDHSESFEASPLKNNDSDVMWQATHFMSIMNFLQKKHLQNSIFW